MHEEPEIIDAKALPKTIRWYIVEVILKGERDEDGWVVFLADVHPDEGFGEQSCWLDLGQHSSRDDAWDFAESLVATRH